MTEKKDISDYSIEKIKELASKAGLEARQKSLESGIEIMSQDEEGNLVYEKMDAGGRIVTRPVPKEDIKYEK